MSLDWYNVEAPDGKKLLLVPSKTNICYVHFDHRPIPLMLEIHHVLPLAMGGSNEPFNKVIICPTGHYNVHRLMRELFENPSARIHGALKEKKMAVRAMKLWDEAGRPGKFAYTA